MDTDRIQAFSDGIFAILITILVLELKIPEYNEGNMLSSLVPYWPLMFSYILTYFYIGVLWLFHHDLFQSIKRTTYKINILNLIMIFFITLLSFSMTLLSTSLKNLNINDLKLSCCIYSFLALMISLFFFFIYDYIYDHPELINEGYKKNHFSKKRIYPLFSILIYSVSFCFTLFNVYMGLFLLVIGILYHGFAYFRMHSFK